MPTILLQLLPGNLVPGACFNDEQSRLNAYAEALNAQLPGQAFYNYGDSIPAVENNGYPWLRTTDMKWYRFSGDWISPVGPEYHVGIRRIWTSSAALLQTYDGGDTNPASDRSGPMWEIDTEWAGRSLMGAGLIPGSDPPKTLANGENYGVASPTLVAGNLPEHRHQIKFSDISSGTGFPQVGTGSTHDKSFNTELAGGSATPTPLNNVHPVRGGYLIKWSGRAFRKAT